VDSPGFADGIKMAGLGFAVLNVSCVSISFLFPVIANRIGPRLTHAGCLTLGGLGFILMLFTSDVVMVLACMVLVGIAWAAIITMPYVMLTSAVPSSRMGVYMGIFNMFICIPQVISMMTVPLFYKTLLGDDPRHALVLLGICLILAAIACFFVSKEIDAQHPPEEVQPATTHGAER
jgi:maltose/moltooligosaccharide transporter